MGQRRPVGRAPGLDPGQKVGRQPLQRRRRPLVAKLAHASEFGIDLLGGPLADMAGIEDDEIRVFHAPGLAIARRSQRIDHALGIVDIHLAAIGLDENLLRIVAHAAFSG